MKHPARTAAASLIVAAIAVFGSTGYTSLQPAPTTAACHNTKCMPEAEACGYSPGTECYWKNGTCYTMECGCS